jgi:DNA-binding MarR family transcriptional regulator
MLAREEVIEKIIELRRRTNRIIRDRALDSWVKLSLTTPQLKSLLYVTRHGKVNLSGLASGIGVTPANVTGIVDRLVQQGLLTRTSDSDDRRVLWLGVTDKGKALVEDLREGGVHEMHNILENLTEEELSTVARGFDVLARSAEADEREELPAKRQ